MIMEELEKILERKIIEFSKNVDDRINAFYRLKETIKHMEEDMEWIKQ